MEFHTEEPARIRLLDMRPTRVLHIIDGLGGGGSERLLWDLVRLSDPNEVVHRVVTVYPDSDLNGGGRYVYADRLRRVGAYCEVAPSEGQPESYDSKNDSTSSETPVDQRKLPEGVKRLLRPIRSVARAGRKRLLEHSGSALIGEIDGVTLSTSCPNQSGEISLTPEMPRRSLLEIIMPDAVRRLIWHYLEFSPDVIHGHTFYGFGLGLFLKLMFRRPMVFTVPSLFSQLEDAGAGYLPDQYKQFHHGVDRFFTGYPSELIKIGVPPGKIIGMNVVVDVQKVSRVQTECARHRLSVRRAAGIEANDLVALSVGRLHPSKGHRYALEALPFLLREFPNLHWVLIGKSSEEESSALKTRARELGVERRVHVIGFVEEPLPFYAAADVYLRTVVFEGDNLSSCQAMAMGLPVIGFDTGKETELIATVGHGALVPVGDSEALAVGVQKILSLPDRGRSLGQRGADYCRVHLDIQLLVDTFRTIYSDVTGKERNERTWN